MHQIANELPGYDCWFSQLFTDNAPLKYLLTKTPKDTCTKTHCKLISVLKKTNMTW
jgi:hypothetical protein